MTLCSDLLLIKYVLPVNKTPPTCYILPHPAQSKDGVRCSRDFHTFKLCDDPCLRTLNYCIVCNLSQSTVYRVNGFHSE